MNKALPKYLLLLMLLTHTALGQHTERARFWYFGQKGSLQMDTVQPKGLRAGALETDEGSAVGVTENGNLLFYTNGINVWDYKHEPMLGGYDLYGHLSATQSALVVPRPTHSNIYYIFTVDAAESDVNRGLNYSMVDVSVPPTGKVIGKNINLLKPCAEKLTAARHANGTDYWVVAHGWGDNKFYAWRLGPGGIAEKPIVSAVGTVHSGGKKNKNAIGYMKIAPKGNKLALAIADMHFEVFDFDNQTGQVSNPQVLPTEKRFCYGVAYSATGRYLFTSIMGLPGHINRYDLTADSIAATRQNIPNCCQSTTMAMQLTPQGNIMVARYGKSAPGIIANTDAPIDQVQYTQTDTLLHNGRYKLGLPNLVQTYLLHKPRINITDSCTLTQASLYLTDNYLVDSVEWFLDGKKLPHSDTAHLQASIYWKKNGHYTIKAIRHMNHYRHTAVRKLQVTMPPKPHLGPDTLFCEPDTIMLNAYVPNTTLRWNDGNTQPQRPAWASNTYIATVTRNGCVAADTIFIDYTLPRPGFLGADTLICLGDSLTLQAPPRGGKVQWQHGPTDSVITVDQTGSYRVYLEKGRCNVRDTLRLTVQPLPHFTLGPDTTLCTTRPLVLRPKPPYNHASYQWGNGAQNLINYATLSGSYQLKINHNGCLWADTVQVNFMMPPQVTLPPDTTLCGGNTLQLTAKVNRADSAQWLGHPNQQYTINAPKQGTYYFKAWYKQCATIDSVVVKHSPTPKFYLPTDTLICDANAWRIHLNVPGAKFQWHDASTQSHFVVRNSRTVGVAVTKYGCTVLDTVKVTFSNHVNFSLGPDKTICQNQPLHVGINNTLPHYSYRWNTGQRTPNISIDSTGQYILTVNNRGCTTTDTLFVKTLPVPQLSITPNDTIVCLNDTIQLTAHIKNQANNNLRLTWHNADTNQSIAVTEPGTYYATASYNQCQTTDTAKLLFTECHTDITVPKVIVVNNPLPDTVTFYVEGMGNLTWRLYIQDKKGNELYRNEKYQNNWIVNDMPSGTYRYILINTAYARVYSGWVKIINNTMSPTPPNNPKKNE